MKKKNWRIIAVAALAVAGIALEPKIVNSLTGYLAEQEISITRREINYGQSGVLKAKSKIAKGKLENHLGNIEVARDGLYALFLKNGFSVVEASEKTDSLIKIFEKDTRALEAEIQKISASRETYRKYVERMQEYSRGKQGNKRAGIFGSIAAKQMKKQLRR